MDAEIFNASDLDAFSAPAGLVAPRPQDWTVLHVLREDCRIRSGGGGMCHEVAEWIEWKFGWPRVEGVYLSKAGEVCIDAHYWNVLPDGAILDCTADQTGEGHDMRLVPVGDVDHGRYDEERHADWNPGMAWSPRTHGMRAQLPYSGESDWEQANRLIKERGHHWWATDLDQLLAYLDVQIAHAAGDEDSGYLAWAKAVHDDVSARRRAEG